MTSRLNDVSDDEKLEFKSTYDVFHDASDDMLTRFLRARKFDSNRTLELMMGEWNEKGNHLEDS